MSGHFWTMCIKGLTSQLNDEIHLRIWLNLIYILIVDVMIDVIDFSLTNCGFQLEFTITLVLEMKRLTYWDSIPPQYTILKWWPSHVMKMLSFIQVASCKKKLLLIYFEDPIFSVLSSWEFFFKCGRLLFQKQSPRGVI